MRRAWLAGALGVICSVPVGADVVFFPDASVRLQAARYVPTETDFFWTGWIGAGAGLVRAGQVTAYGTAEVETILGNTLRPFEANQANYHLELGLRRPVGRWEIAPFFHHCSRHYVDRPKVQAVDWNVLGVQVSRVLHPGGRPLQMSASLGRTTQASLPGYQWEATAAVELTLRDEAEAQPYARARGRLVTVRDDPDFPRGDFLDRSGEIGLRLSRAAHAVELFAAAERRNDVFLEMPGARTRALLGLRILARTR